MALAQYNPTSPYAITPQASWYLGYYRHRPVVPSGDDKLIVIEARYDLRPDLLSHELYQTSRLWWVFMIRNPNVLKDPIYDFRAGTQIYIPTLDRLNRQLPGG